MKRAAVTAEAEPQVVAKVGRLRRHRPRSFADETLSRRTENVEPDQRFSRRAKRRPDLGVGAETLEEPHPIQPPGAGPLVRGGDRPSMHAECRQRVGHEADVVEEGDPQPQLKVG